MLPLSVSARDFLSQTSLPQAAVFSTTLPGIQGLVHAVEVDKRTAVPLWQELQPLLAGTGYVALVTCFWNGRQAAWQASICTDLPEAVGRFFFDEEVTRQLPGMQSADPASIIQASAAVDAQREVQAQLKQFRVKAEDLAWEVERLEGLHGRGPDLEPLELAMLDPAVPPFVSHQRAAFEWERSQGLRPPQQGPVPWYEPREPMALLLLPLQQPEHALALLHWWGSSVLGTPATIALLARWRQAFGAQLVCHYGTMLQFQVAHPPTDPGQAFELAVELETVAASSGIGELAWHLMGVDRWFVHNRP